jgi:hypothetical protein
MEIPVSLNFSIQMWYLWIFGYVINSYIWNVIFVRRWFRWLSPSDREDGFFRFIGGFYYILSPITIITSLFVYMSLTISSILIYLLVVEE